MNLLEVAELFINRPELAAATRKTYAYDLKSLINYLGAGRPVADIIPADMLRYSQYLDNRETLKSDVTYNKHLISLKAFFNFCVDAGIIVANPAKILRRKRVSQRVPKSKAMPDAKLRKLLSYVSQSPRGWHPREESLVRFLADTGVRIGSAAHLHESNLDLKNCTAHVEMKNMVDLHTVRFGRECKYALSTWLLRRNTSRGKFVFSTDGHKMGNDHLGQYFRRLCKRAGIGSWGPHSLRHRFGHKAAAKFSPSIAAGMLGDTIEVFLQHYAPRDDESIQRAMMQMTTDHLITSDLLEIELPNLKRSIK